MDKGVDKSLLNNCNGSTQGEVKSPLLDNGVRNEASWPLGPTLGQVERSRSYPLLTLIPHSNSPRDSSVSASACGPFLRPCLAYLSGDCDVLGPARLVLWSWGSWMPDGVALGVLGYPALTSVNPRVCPRLLLSSLPLFSLLLRSSAPFQLVASCTTVSQRVEDSFPKSNELLPVGAYSLDMECAPHRGSEPQPNWPQLMFRLTAFCLLIVVMHVLFCFDFVKNNSSCISDPLKCFEWK